ncbi:DUF559 domain-containing protein [Nakamurella silvestris]|nr:DUF559 domain-containing protein [Nakamurella silvestris]
MDLRARISTGLSRQDGIITTTQALRWGMSRGQLRTQLRSGEWIPVHPGVFRARSAPASPRSAARAAAWWAGEGAVLSGETAAWWWGFVDRPPPAIEITVPHGRGIRASPDLDPPIRILRRFVDPVDRCIWAGVPVTSQPLTAVQAAVRSGRPHILDRALQRSVSLVAVEAALARHPAQDGAKAAATLLAAASDRTAAESERMFARILRRNGITGWQVNTRVIAGGSVPDFRFDAERVIVEIDGWAWHHTPDRFQRDRARQNELILQGWTVLRFTWFDLTQRPAEVLSQVCRALGR